ncbi:phage tail protein [Streptomyces sp. NPDC091281]|uniref:phage tail protein n=1 Tax=Streptomyces sp. NPDC091281 TaxID=3365985 RepID=UPI00382048C0
MTTAPPHPTPGTPLPHAGPAPTPRTAPAPAPTPGFGPGPVGPPLPGLSGASAGDRLRPGLAMRFHVTLDERDVDLGLWSSCHGLQVSFGSKEIVEGGQYCDRTLLPDRVTYGTVTLERMMTAADSPRLQAWLAGVAARWTGYEYDGGRGGSYQGQDVTIRLFDHQGALVTGWVLQRATPKEWTGPDLDARSNAVAIERLSFEHSGFLAHAGDRPGVPR